MIYKITRQSEDLLFYFENQIKSVSQWVFLGSVSAK